MKYFERKDATSKRRKHMLLFINVRCTQYEIAFGCLFRYSFSFGKTTTTTARKTVWNSKYITFAISRMVVSMQQERKSIVIRSHASKWHGNGRRSHRGRWREKWEAKREGATERARNKNEAIAIVAEKRKENPTLHKNAEVNALSKLCERCGAIVR